MNFHPHIHALVLGGGLDVKNHWKDNGKDFFLPIKVISKTFRGKYMAGSVIIIHNQHPERRQTVMFFRCALAQAEGQFHSKCCPFALPASD